MSITSKGITEQRQLSQETRMLWVHALSPLHVGAGRGTGSIDLPIIREKATRWPFIPGSSLKGVLSSRHNAVPTRREGQARRAFGAADEQNGVSGNAGSLVFPDVRLVCFPVRSLNGTFAWCTCEFALRRLQRDLRQCGCDSVPEEIPVVYGEQVVVDAESVLVAGGEAVFEEFVLTSPDEPATDAAVSAHRRWSELIGKAIFDEDWQAIFRKRMAIISNDLFDYLVEQHTEVAARIAIDADSKTVKQTGLWYEESLPAETILSGFLWTNEFTGTGGRADASLLDDFFPRDLNLQVQIGGKASVNRGLATCWFR